MGLGQTIIYIVVPVVVVIYLLISDTTGLNFSLKVNFIANFMAPLLAYTAISTLGLAYTFTDTKNTMLEFGLIGALTFLITYVVAVISMYKAAKDKTKDGIGASKVSCKNYKMSSALKHGMKISIIGIITFLLVSLYPVLQKPFTNLSSKMGVEDPEKMAYGIVGFYMAFMSLSGTAMSYFPALEEGCTMTDEEITDAFNKGYPTLNYMKYANKNKINEDKVYNPKENIKGFYFDEKTGQFELKAGKSSSTKGKTSTALSYKQGDTIEAIKLINCENGKTIKKGKRFVIDTIGGTGTFITVKTLGVAGTTPITITIDKANINASNAKVISKAAANSTTGAANSTTGAANSTTRAANSTTGAASRAKAALAKTALAKVVASGDDYILFIGPKTPIVIKDDKPNADFSDTITKIVIKGYFIELFKNKKYEATPISTYPIKTKVQAKYYTGKGPKGENYKATIDSVKIDINREPIYKLSWDDKDSKERYKKEGDISSPENGKTAIIRSHTAIDKISLGPGVYDLSDFSWDYSPTAVVGKTIKSYKIYKVTNNTFGIGKTCNNFPTGVGGLYDVAYINDKKSALFCSELRADKTGNKWRKVWRDNRKAVTCGVGNTWGKRGDDDICWLENKARTSGKFFNVDKSSKHWAKISYKDLTKPTVNGYATPMNILLHKFKNVETNL